MNDPDDVSHPGLILATLVAGLLGIAVLCLATPADPGAPAPAPTVVVSTMR
jgi:hypothetical protein